MPEYEVLERSRAQATPESAAGAGSALPVIYSRRPFGEIAAYLGLALIVLYATIRNICHAFVRPFWFDEICTVLMVRQQHLATLWQASKHGADSAPMFLYFVERVFVSLISNQELAYRAVSILGFALTLIFLFVAVRKRKGPMVALACVLVPMLSMLFEVFAVEARGYSMVAACIAFGLVCYQRVDSKHWVILLALSLVLAESFHYFAVFAFFPFLAAEATYFAINRRLRGSVWLALMAGFVPLAVFWPVLAAEHRYYGEHFWWPKATVQAALGSYSWYFLWIDAPWGPPLAGLAVVAVLTAILLTLREKSLSQDARTALLPEYVFVLVLLCLPLIGYAVAAITKNGVIEKYFLSAILGFSLTLGIILPKPRRWASAFVVASAALLLCLLVSNEFRFWSGYTGKFVNPARYVQDLVSAGGYANLPVVVSDSHDFMMLQIYADPEWKKRFVVVLDPQQEIAYTGNDAGDRNLAIFRQYTDLPIYDFQPFLADHPSFLVYSGRGGLERDWWPARLKHDGFTMKNVSVPPVENHDYMHRVVLVTR